MNRERNELAWCSVCEDKDPPYINKSEYLVPARVGPYDLGPDGLTIDSEVMGVCSCCLVHLNKFQRGRKRLVGATQPHLVYKSK